MKKAILISACLILTFAAALLAGANTDAKVAVHVRVHNAKLGCNYGTITGCGDIVYTLEGSNVDAFPVFFNLAEYTGCEMGLDFPAESAGFTSCSDFVIGGITAPGEGSSHTWTACLTGVCVPCYIWFYASGPGLVCPVPFTGTGLVSVLDCLYFIDDLNLETQIGCAGVYGATGDDPCAIPGGATAPATWGQVKSLFR
jgi:hypothetical protein